MKILVCTNLFKQGNTGNLAIKALGELGHTVVLWDNNVSPEPPKIKCDVSLVWTNKFPDVKLLQGRKILIFLDDSSYHKQNKTGIDLKIVKKGYDEIFTLHKHRGYKHLPMGCDENIHKPIDLTEEEKNYYGADVTFIGTLRDRGRLDFIKNFANLLNPKYKLKVWGNGWAPFGILANKPVYFQEFNKVVNASKIVIMEHFSNSGPSTKDFEVQASGSALAVCDEVDAVKEIYPKIPTYRDAVDAVKIAEYYLEHKKEREKLVQQMRKQASKYSYKNQLKNILGSNRKV